ncbi:MAG: ABC transporter ATP-binding protein [Sulfuritalea sp.]|nr:ABC transporter ATP-binding protein [Sulfuritalea sp.]
MATDTGPRNDVSGAQSADSAAKAPEMGGALEVELRQQTPIPLDCAFDCAPGELLALVGPSGSGKTTVLRCIAGLHSATEGSIRCGGANWFGTGVSLPPQQRRVGFVFQNYSLLPHLSAFDNVMMALGDVSPASRAETARHWLARVHLDGLDGRRPAQLSGGQQQRVALARALARAAGGPAALAGGVLLMDEPFSAVDQVTRRKLRAELARLRQELAIPIVLVTHDLDEARQLADRMVVLHRGKALQTGSPEDVLLRPCSPAVARLVGLTNLFQGTLIEGDGKTCLEWAGCRLTIADFPSGAAGWAPGEQVNWVIPPEGVLLHRPDHPSRGEAENPVTGTIIEALRMGSFTQLTLSIPGEAQPLAFQASSHTIQRNKLGPGQTASVTLLAERIHLMPKE